MFTHAVRAANSFTFPYVGLRRRRNGEVYSTMGAFVILNQDGWALTSAHLVQEIFSVEHEKSGEGDGPTDLAVTSHAEIWAIPGFAESKPAVTEVIVRPIADAALVRLQPFDAALLPEAPVLRDPATDPVEAGASVVRVGYPFHNVNAAWDDAAEEFQLTPDAFPVPSFALDGIVARFHRMASDDGAATATFIETSTPGLRGQSGGPLLDVQGRLCGIQSHTTHLDLGFDARYVSGDTTVSERQFLNVGAATHVADVRAMLEEAGVRYRTSAAGHWWSPRP
jgi:S1-C subfamily serine protease